MQAGQSLVDNARADLPIQWLLNPSWTRKHTLEERCQDHFRRNSFEHQGPQQKMVPGTFPGHDVALLLDFFNPLVISTMYFWNSSCRIFIDLVLIIRIKLSSCSMAFMRSTQLW